MNKRRFLALGLGMAFLAAVPASAQGAAAGKSVLEKVEWTWADGPEKPDSNLSNILLLGDSITRAYFPDVTKLLAGKANVYLFATSASTGDPRLPQQIRDYFVMEDRKFEVVHFNNGMHGWGYSDTQYAAALPAVVHTLKNYSPACKLMWASTTPVQSDAESGASNERIDIRNAAALKLIRQLAIPIDDQHLLMSAHGDLHSDRVHFNQDGSMIQARQAAQALDQFLIPAR